jgi:hypothetical protein
MKERGWIEPIVTRVVGQVLDSHTAQLRTEIIRRIMEEIAAAPAAAEKHTHTTASASDSAELARAVAEIQLGTSQREILRALLDASSRFAARIALFVVKGRNATGWQARGFANSDAVKDFALDENSPAVHHAIADRVSANVPVARFDQKFLREVGMPASGEGRVLPLILKDKVAALVYADSGTGAAGLLDAGSLDLLVISTGSWLEVNALRKQVQKEPSAPSVDSPHAGSHGASVTETLSYPAPVSPATAYIDPFASHASGHARAAAATASAGEASMPIPGASVEAPAMAGLPHHTPHGSSISPDDEEVHRKAQRFARLLVDEVKLYNQAKVAEGRKNKDIYDRLKETIEKSRAIYEKRYGNTVAASANYFQNEIVRSLAEDDLSIMGANFRQ